MVTLEEISCFFMTERDGERNKRGPFEHLDFSE
jgi:hypothetical protein